MYMEVKGDKFTSCLILCALAALLMGCAPDMAREGGEGQVALRLTASMSHASGQSGTRAGTTVQSTQFDIDELFYAYFPTGVSIDNTYSGNGTNFRVVSINGQGKGITSPAMQPYFNPGISTVKVHAYYPAGYSTEVKKASTTFSVDLDQSQTKTANYKASDLMYATEDVTVDKTNATSATGELVFTHKMSKIIVNAVRGQGIASINYIRIVGGSRTVNVTAPLTCTLGTVNASGNLSTTNYIKMYDNGADASVDCAALIPPQTVNGAFIEVGTTTTAGQTGVATYRLTDVTFVSGHSYSYAITIQLSDIGVTTEITDWVSIDALALNNFGSETIVGPENSPYLEAVDLGDAVTVLWASLNVGAFAETDFGNYYAWGETAVKDEYSQENAIMVVSVAYNASDPVTTLRSEHDCARVNMGSPWRLPTAAEVTNLVNNTTLTEETLNDVPCWRLSSKTNSNFIIIPKAGRWWKGGPTGGFDHATDLYLTASVNPSNWEQMLLMNLRDRSTYPSGWQTATRMYGVGYPARAVQNK